MSVRANLAALVPLCGAYLSCTARINDYFSCNVRNAIPPPPPPSLISLSTHKECTSPLRFPDPVGKRDRHLLISVRL